MKLLTFTDLHEDKKPLRELIRRAAKPDIDFVVCCGDISTFGRGLRSVLQKFNKVGKKMYVIPGNHEEGGTMLDDAMAGLNHCVNFNQKSIEVDSYIFLGYGGNGFAQQDQEFRKIARRWYGKYKNKKIIFVTHAPPFDTTIDLLHERHVGQKDYRKFIERIKPKLVICGHLHETVGMIDTIGKTKVINPGWDGMVIELK